MAVVLNTLTNLCATAEEPYNYIAGCFGGAAMASPAADVWYSFVATGTEVDIDVASTGASLTQPNIALYEIDPANPDCDSLYLYDLERLVFAKYISILKTIQLR